MMGHEDAQRQIPEGENANGQIQWCELTSHLAIVDHVGPNHVEVETQGASGDPTRQAVAGSLRRGRGLEGQNDGLLVHDRAGRLTQHGVREIHDARLGDPGDPARMVECAGYVRVFCSHPGEDLPGF